MFDFKETRLFLLFLKRALSKFAMTKDTCKGRVTELT